MLIDSLAKLREFSNGGGNDTGSVIGVNGQTGAVTLTGLNIQSAVIELQTAVLSRDSSFDDVIYNLQEI